MRHWLTCWFISRHRKRTMNLPFWKDDPWAQVHGYADKGCPRCGRGAVTV